jgi:hypothetical protein
MRLQTLVMAALWMAVLPVVSAAQQTAETTSVTVVSARQDTAQRFLEAAAKPNADVAMTGLLLNQFEYLALIGKQGTLLKVLQDLEERRSDKQLGAVASSSGTTTLVSKGTVPKVLAFAVENGAATQAQSGTVVTFRTNFAGALRALAGKGFLELTPREFRVDPAMTLFSRLSGSASFDTSRGNAPGEFTADRQQLSQWTARIEIINHRD